MLKDKTFAELVVKRKIEQILKNNMYGSIDSFIDKNPTLSIFIQNNNLTTVLSHSNSNITDEDYQNILSGIKNVYQPKNNNVNEILLTKNDDLEKTIVLPPIIEKEEDTFSKQPQLVKKQSLTEFKNGFIDAAILAFITGSFFGALFINLYINIISAM